MIAAALNRHSARLATGVSRQAGKARLAMLTASSASALWRPAEPGHDFLAVRRIDRIDQRGHLACAIEHGVKRAP